MSLINFLTRQHHKSFSCDIDWTDPIVVSGVLRLPLYHGTSTLWLDSINRHGLGGSFPPIAEAVALLGEILDRIPSSERDLGSEKIVKQEEGVMNWQHGQVYFSLSFQKAKDYAESNSTGSELLSDVIGYAEKYNLLSLLPKWLADLKDAYKTPVVIKVSGVEVESLELECRGRGTVVDELARLDSLRLKKQAEFDEIEAVREEVRQGVLDRLDLLWKVGRIQRKDHVDSFMDESLYQTFRLKAGLLIPADQLEIIEFT